MSLTTYCRKHGKQLAVGNWDECEKCVIEDAEEQEYQRNIKNHKSIMNTVNTGKW